MKQKSTFFCQNCGFETSKWTGKCPNCEQWNTFVEEKVEKTPAKIAAKTNAQAWTVPGSPALGTAVLLEDVLIDTSARILMPDAELNRTLGGGMVMGSLTLVAGEPGIGKSTLFLQAALEATHLRTLYVSGEESASQIKMRAERIGKAHPNFYLLTATDTSTIFKSIKEVEPQWVIVDSIQTLASPYIESAPGSVSQVRESAAELQRYAKQSGIPVTLIGHITKDGSIAGPKILEHMVDTVLQFEGDRHFSYRILRTLKNRYGSTSELGIYEMMGNGMRPVSNPSEIMITHHDEALSGIAIAASIEGIRPMMIETQALVSPAVYGTPQRTTNGFDLRRLQLLLAVLDKRGGFQFGSRDVFLNITGGIKVEDPGIDLAIVCALLSSYQDQALPPYTCAVGEVGLSGEIRAVPRIDQRITEATKLGMQRIIVPAANSRSIEIMPQDIQVIFAGKVSDVYQGLFGK